MTITQKKELKIIQNEVLNYYNDLPKEEDKYVKMFYSNLSNETDIMFIGINPGYYSDKNSDYIDTKIMDQFQYFCWEKHPLAKDTFEVFKLAGYYDKLLELNKENKIVKTNLYYLSSKGSTELLKKYINVIPKFQDKHFDWTMRIINICQPKLIILEGKFLTSLFHDLKILKQYNFEIKNNLSIENTDISRFDLNNKIAAILYKRIPRQSGINNKPIVAKILKTELDKIYK